MQTVLLHGPAYLEQARLVARRLNPDADTRRSWTHHLNALQASLDSARHQHDSWPAPGPFLGDDDRSREDLAAETWHEMIQWSIHGPVAANILRRATDSSSAGAGRRSAATRHSHAPTGPIPPQPTASEPGNSRSTAAGSSRRPQRP